MNLLNLIEELIETGEGIAFDTWEREIVMTLCDRVPHYTWVGFYWLVGDRLVLGAWDGPGATERISIRITEGICGLAARREESVIVNDVSQHPEYQVCFPTTKSEIVIPIFHNNRMIGEIDVNSDKTEAFTRDDESALTRLAYVIGERRYNA